MFNFIYLDYTMAKYSIYGKRKLCYTDLTDYTDYQGIGHDPLYKRFDSVMAVVRQHVPQEYHHFLAQPLYLAEEDTIEWYIENWQTDPIRLNQLKGAEKEHYEQILDQTMLVYRSCLDHLEGEDRFILSGALKYVDKAVIYCYADKVALVAWGMTPDTRKHIVKGAIVHDFVIEKKFTITFDAGCNGHLTNALNAHMKRAEGFVLTRHDLPAVVPNDDFIFNGWEPQPIDHKVTDNVTFHAVYKPIPKPEPAPPVMAPTDSTEKSSEPALRKVRISFQSSSYGSISGTAEYELDEGTPITNDMIPEVEAESGYNFVGWTPTIPNHANHDITFQAQYERRSYICRFVAGEHGSIEGNAEIHKYEGESINADELPNVKPERGYKFTTWDVNPEETRVYTDLYFTAQYVKLIPWYRRLCAWLKSEKVMKWIKYILLLLFFILLLMLISRSCTSCERESNEVVPVNQITTPDGRVIDNNRPIDRIGGGNGDNGDQGNGKGENNDQDGNNEQGNNGSDNGGSDNGQGNQDGSVGKKPGSQDGITDGKGQLPKDKSTIVAPIMGDDGTPPPIHKQPGKPDIVANRLNIYFEDDNTDLQAFATQFKSLYADEKYQIIGCDDKVKFIQIQIPEEERVQIRQALPEQFSEFRFFIVDESLFMGRQHNSANRTNPGWHLKAVHAHEAWQLTRGNKDVMVAVVDDGIDYQHNIFHQRIVRPYNVFTQSNALSMGSGHGTHVAGLAVGSSEYIDRGVSGMAPECSLMPIQVFDNNFSTFSSVTSGIMYAIHQGADVVNVSIGPSLEGISQLPIGKQRQIADNLFKNEEKVWQKIIGVANSKNCILVFAVGNDKILACIPPENRIGTSVNVAAVDHRFQPAHFSNYGEGANISSPGMDIYSSFPTSTFKAMDGTSMAAPIVAGTVALMKSLDRNITVEQVIRVLQYTGQPTHRILPPMVRADRALQVVQSGDYDNIPSYGDSDNEVDGNYHNKDQNNSDIARPDYERIRALIAEYEKKIKELKQLLPENK